MVGENSSKLRLLDGRITMFLRVVFDLFNRI